jgi:virginiamycin A acetyltransferase
MVRHGNYRHLTWLLHKLYGIDNRIIRKIIIRAVSDLEGGELYSKTLREIFAIYHDIKIGMYSYGSCFDLANTPAGTIIGRYCSFARNVSILNGNHPIKFKSVHPFFFNPVLGYINRLLIKRTKLIIGNDVWIGRNVTILPSVSCIADGSVIGAGSVVVKDVPPYAVVAGNPAKIIRYRFSEKTINEIIQSAWWNKSIEELRENQYEFESFIKPLEIAK